MNIYLVDDPKLYTQFGRFSRVGTWTSGTGLCKECGGSTQRITEPFQVEWEPDSDNIGDFSWSSYSAVVKGTVGIRLIEKGLECSLGVVEVVPPTTPRKKRKLVPFPYVGPELKWLRPTEKVALDEERSEVPLLLDCRTCGRKKYKFKTDDLLIPKTNWHGQKMFLMSQFAPSDATFVTEEGVNAIDSLGITNVTFKKAGLIA